MTKEPILNPNTSLFTKVLAVLSILLLIGALGVQIFVGDYHTVALLLWCYVVINSMYRNKRKEKK